MNEHHTISYFSTFSGIGGFELGIERAYLRTHKQQKREEACISLPRHQLHSQSKCTRRWPSPYRVGFSELDKYAIQIYQRHFPEHQNYGDITKINGQTLPDFELLVGGFPCQAFSIAGNRRGFEDTRGTLFFDLARILAAKQPRLCLLENVKGLLSHDQGRTFFTIISTLDELGYDIQWQVLNSKNQGVPQNRERVFIVGHLRGTPRPEVFPIEACRREDTAAHSKISNVVSVALTEARTESAKRARRKAMEEGRDWSPRRGKELVPRKDDKANTLTGNTGREQLLACPPQARPHGSIKVEPPQTLVRPQTQIRRLTPTECERLQGFPDGWTEGVSDTQRYKCLGNAVTVNVVQAIMERLM